MPLAEAEKSLQQSISLIVEETREITNKLNNVANDEQNLDEKIDRKKREFEQMQKRFAKLQVGGWGGREISRLQSFRPQYMDEYEKYEERLKELYKVGLLRERQMRENLRSTWSSSGI